MKYNLTQEQFLTYIYGPEKSQKIQENPKKNHYVKAFEKLQNGKKFVWNWAAFFGTTVWSVYRRIPHIGSILILFAILMSILISIILIEAGIVNNKIAGLIIGLASAISGYIMAGGFGDYFLIRHISKQVKKGNACPFPNGGPLTMAILSGIIPLFILIAILHNKYIVSRYRQAKKQES